MKSESLPYPIVDAHVHLLDTQSLNYPWLEHVPAINHSYGTDDYDRVTADCTVAQYVCVEAAVAEGQSRQEFAWLNKLSASDKRLAGIVAYADVSEGAFVQAELDSLAPHAKLKGIRFTLGKAYQKNPKLCLEKSFIEGVRCLEQYGLSFDLAFDPVQSADIYTFARACPNVQLVINHSGKPDIAGQVLQPWLHDMKALASLPNVACKISDILRDSAGKTEAELFRPYVHELIKMFGISRLMFGGDFPVVTMYGSYVAQLQILKSIFKDFSPSEQQDFFYNNARRIYQLQIL